MREVQRSAPPHGLGGVTSAPPCHPEVSCPRSSADRSAPTACHAHLFNALQGGVQGACSAWLAMLSMHSMACWNETNKTQVAAQLEDGLCRSGQLGQGVSVCCHKMTRGARGQLKGTDCKWRLKVALKKMRAPGRRGGAHKMRQCGGHERAGMCN